MSVPLLPSYDEFLALTAQGNLIPVHAELTADYETPLSAFEKIGDEAIDLIGFSAYTPGWSPGFDADAQSRLHPKAFAITEGGPPSNEDDVPSAYNSTYLSALDAWYPRAAFFVIWNSWPTGPFVAIKDNANYVPLLTDPRVTNRERVNYRNTTACWKAGNGLLNQRLDADPESDGIANLLEAAMGLDPLAASTIPVAQSLVSLGGQTYLALTYTRDPGILDLATSVEWSGDLLQWSRGMTTDISRMPQNGLEVITVRSNLPTGTGPQFMRVTVDEL